MIYMGLAVRKPVFLVSDKVRLELVFSATETSQKNFLCANFQKSNNKGADQFVWMPRLVLPLLFAYTKDRFSSVKAHIMIHLYSCINTYCMCIAI